MPTHLTTSLSSHRLSTIHRRDIDKCNITRTGTYLPVHLPTCLLLLFFSVDWEYRGANRFLPHLDKFSYLLSLTIKGKGPLTKIRQWSFSFFLLFLDDSNLEHETSGRRIQVSSLGVNGRPIRTRLINWRDPVPMEYTFYSYNIGHSNNTFNLLDVFYYSS